MTFEERLAYVADLVEASLNERLHEFPSGDLRDAMIYASSGGKRLRAFLVLEGAALHGVGQAAAMGCATAIEAIHAYSLVHDDLPCMDNDDLRRGQPTVHRKWDEATAVLAGDALQSFAFAQIAQCDVDQTRKIELIQTLSDAAGANGMVYGQALAIAAENADAPLTLDEITTLQAGKTGALIEWSACAGPRLAGADVAPLQTYARALGLAFQIADDILDETGDEAKAGKRLKKDANAGKATFVSLLGLNGAKERARALVAEAIDALCIYDAKADHLRAAADFVISRQH